VQHITSDGRLGWPSPRHFSSKALGKMKGVTMPGPYFIGQQPSSCGHYYPDVLRLRDEKREDGTFVRITDCRYCGRDEFQLDPVVLDKELVRKLNKKGLDTGVREEEIPEVRKKALERLLLR
jgi:hypothetical protein